MRNRRASGPWSAAATGELGCGQSRITECWVTNRPDPGWEAQDDNRRIADRIHTVGDDFCAEQRLLARLPAETLDPGLVLHPRVDRSAMVTVRMAKYRFFVTEPAPARYRRG